MEDIKKSLLRDNDNDLGTVQAIVQAGESTARNCGFMNDPSKFDDLVLAQLTTTNDFMYILGQQGNVKKQDLITNDDPSTFPKFRWGKNILALVPRCTRSKWRQTEADGGTEADDLPLRFMN